MKRVVIAALAPLVAGATAPPQALQVELRGLRSTRGVLQACLTAQARHFPDCAKDPHAIWVTVPAAAAAVRFTGFRPGRYAVTLFHDENGNRKLDTVLGIPREGFGFSRNPAVRFGAPKFSQVQIDLPAGQTRQVVRMKYLL